MSRREKKQVVSGLLLIVMLVGVMLPIMEVGVIGAEIVKAEEEASEYLSKNGVLLGDEQGNLMLGDKLQRRDVVIMLSRLLGLEEEAKDYKVTSTSPSWSDVVDEPGYYKNFLSWGESEGFFEGTGAGTFEPRSEITVREYTIVLLRALGYKASGQESWEMSMSSAEHLGLLDGIDVERDTRITRGEMSVMTYNALAGKVNGRGESLSEVLGLREPKKVLGGAVVVELGVENLKEIRLELKGEKSRIEGLREKLEDRGNYKLQSNEVETIEIEGKEVVLELKEAMLEGKEYKIYLEDILRGVDGEYVVEAVDKSMPEVEEVRKLGERGILVKTSEPIKRVRPGDIRIEGVTGGYRVELYGRDILLTPRYAGGFKDVSKLRVGVLEDYAGKRTKASDHKIAGSTHLKEQGVENIMYTGDTVYIKFKEAVDGRSIELQEGVSRGNISYRLGGKEIYPVKGEQVGLREVKYRFEKELPNQARVSVRGLRGYTGEAMGEEWLDVVVSLDYTGPRVVSKEVETDTHNRTARIVLEFDRAVYGIDVEGESIRDVIKVSEREPRELAREVEKLDQLTYGDKKNIVVIKLKDLERGNNQGGVEYGVELCGLYSEGILESKMEREVVGLRLASLRENMLLEDISIVSRGNKTEISLTFNSEISKESLTDASSLYIYDKEVGELKTVSEIGGKLTTSNQGRTVEIELENFSEGRYAYIEVSREITDRDGNKLERDYNYTFSLENLNNGEYVQRKEGTKRVIEPNPGVRSIVLESGQRGEYELRGSLEDMELKTPKGELTVSEGASIGKLRIQGIDGELRIRGRVGGVHLAKGELREITGDIRGIKLTSEKTQSTMVRDKDGKSKRVSIRRGETKDLGVELSLEVEVELDITTPGVEYKLKSKSGELQKSVGGKYKLNLGGEYTLSADGYRDRELTITEGGRKTIRMIKK